MQIAEPAQAALAMSDAYAQPLGYDRELGLACALARRAGREILAHYGRSDFQLKFGSSPWPLPTGPRKM